MEAGELYEGDDKVGGGPVVVEREAEAATGIRRPVQTQHLPPLVQLRLEAPYIPCSIQSKHHHLGVRLGPVLERDPWESTETLEKRLAR